MSANRRSGKAETAENVETAETAETETAKPVVVAVKIDAETWDKAVLKGFRESRARTNSKILEMAIREYVADEQ